MIKTIIFFPQSKPNQITDAFLSVLWEETPNLNAIYESEVSKVIPHLQRCDDKVLGLYIDQSSEKYHMSHTVSVLAHLSDKFPLTRMKTFLIGRLFDRNTIMNFAEFNIASIFSFPFQTEKILKKWKLINHPIISNTSLDSQLADILEYPNLKQALIESDLFIKNNPHQPQPHFVRAILLERASQLKEAESHFLQALIINPNYLPAINRLTELLVKTKAYLDAYGYLAKFQQINPYHLKRMLLFGQTCLELEKLDRAESLFKQALEIDQSLPDAKIGLGKVFFHKGDLDKSRFYLDQPDYQINLARYFNKLGIGLINNHNYFEAISLYRKAQHVIPGHAKDVSLLFNQALAFKKWSKYDKALEIVKLTLIKDPNYIKAIRLYNFLQKRKNHG